MVENCIGVASLPMGVAPYFVINGQHYLVPMCVEEPSVIAAASGAAKLIGAAGGFSAHSTRNIMTAQIQLCDIVEPTAAIQLIEDNKSNLIDIANSFCSSMKQRGGGVVDLYARHVMPRRARSIQSQGFVVVYIDVDVCEAMGANIVNTVAEGLASSVEQMTGGRAALRILTNLCTKRRTISSFRIPVEQLKWKGVTGRTVAERILEAYYFADDDPMRASTHNKGIMNGMDAVSVALGQDWRAIESGAHAWAARDGYYAPLTSYSIEESVDGASGDKNAFLVGRIELPLSVGTRGGALQTHPMYQFTHSLLGNPDAATLAQIIASVGLAQNFAAIRALAIEGIQRGHMGLHARNIAVAAGVPHALVSEVAAYMVSRNKINAATAKEYLDAHSLYCSTIVLPPLQPVTPSTFSVELSVKDPVTQNRENMNINVVFASFSQKPVHLIISEHHASQPLLESLLGPNKGHHWLEHVFDLLGCIRLTAKAMPRANHLQPHKLKLVSILMNVIANQLLHSYPSETGRFLQRAVTVEDRESDVRESLMELIPMDNPVLCVGLPLILALWRVFYYTVEQWVAGTHPLLAQALLQQQCLIVNSIWTRPNLYDDLLQDHSLDRSQKVLEFMKVHAKRWQATMFLLCDLTSISPAHICEERLDFVEKLGEYFEWEGTFAHDINRLQRDSAEHGPNVCCLFLQSSSSSANASNETSNHVPPPIHVPELESKSASDSPELLSEFMALVNDVAAKRQQTILESTEDSEFFDADHFLLTARHIRTEYGMAALPSDSK
eukprot:TRINITY_DN3704_c0_g1_i9.p1 TRINITY_DN3704_c0_g1~~TRINITY_DN3704_c0_g1_i9.p1  ORF type:complete len:782 (-),score=188.15 TRINITY_DN3704_c0_g1_i9:97-2442(-)